MPALMNQRSSTLQAQPAPLNHRRRQRRLQAAGRHRRQVCKAEADGLPGQPGRDEILERINRAKEYKKKLSEAAQPAESSIEVAQAQPAAGTAAPEVTAPLVKPTSENVVQTFNDAAQALAAQEEASFLAAISQAQQSSRDSRTGRQQSPGVAGPSSPGSSGASSKEAVLARINAARQYKLGGGAASAGSGSSPGKPAVHSPPQQPGVAEQQPLAAEQRQQQDQQGQQEQQLDAAAERSFRTGSGGADEAANWLKFAGGSGGADDQIDASLSAEQFTIAKEERKKLREVEIVTVDAGYAEQVRREKRAQQGGGAAADSSAAAAAAQGAAEAGSEEDMHRPKVATWGLFPRPRNISETYGGGCPWRPAWPASRDSPPPQGLACR